jgi:hypothetical protein
MDNDALRGRLEHALDDITGVSVDDATRRLRIQLLLAQLYVKRAHENPNRLQYHIAELVEQTCERLVQENQGFDVEEEAHYTARLHKAIRTGLEEERKQPTDMWQANNYELMAGMTTLYLVNQGFNPMPVITYRPLQGEYTSLEAVRHFVRAMRPFVHEWRRQAREISCVQ